MLSFQTAEKKPKKPKNRQNSAQKSHHLQKSNPNQTPKPQSPAQIQKNRKALNLNIAVKFLHFCKIAPRFQKFKKRRRFFHNAPKIILFYSAKKEFKVALNLAPSRVRGRSPNRAGRFKGVSVGEAWYSKGRGGKAWQILCAGCVKKA
jgi:hypothetical protein